MTGKRRNLAASVRDRLRRYAAAGSGGFLVTLQRYAIERLLYRLSVSPKRDGFVLKGAVLLNLWGAQASRVTRLYLLDTDTVSFALRGQGDASTNIREHRPSELCVSAISVAELRFGAESRGSKKIHRALDGFLQAIAILAFDQRAANSFGTIAAFLESRGEPIGPLDTMIAAHAISVGATLVTNNTKHFSRVPNLVIANWV